MITIVIPTTKERRERLQLTVEAIRNNSNYPHRILIYENEDGGWVKAALNAIDGISGPICFMSDDMIPQKDWLKLLMDKYDNNFVYPDDGINNGSVATVQLCDADYFRKYMFPEYHHNFGDTELTEIARIQGKLIYVPESKIIHNHWTKGANRDNTYLTQVPYFEHDKNLFNSRKSNNFYL